MRNDGTKILSQTGLLLAAGSSSSMGRDVHCQFVHAAFLLTALKQPLYSVPWKTVLHRE
ncbi:hypothetical protein DPMN_140085 [Dreissena polymorpha]|uniref:Uncharacterized protein n=1 Tax=Dreissena polymorpha TaxID=45954 RepID=A0A9D4G740_DREPO|nr:hypothetical protein DPMN_140085 [Dreissena polymorpha]